MTPEAVDGLIAQPDIDGLLVGDKSASFQKTTGVNPRTQSSPIIPAT